MAGTDESTEAGGSGAAGSANSGTPNGPGSAKKRLLPMELRRRRRAAKLQITSEKNVATISAKDIIESIQASNTPDDTASKEAAQTSDGDLREESKRQREDDTVTTPQPATSNELARPTSGGETVVNDPRPESSPSTAVSTTKRLQNLFSFSLLDRKRQKLQHRESLVEVPMSMKVDHVPVDVTLKSKVVISMSFVYPFMRPRAASMAKAMAIESASTPEVQWLRSLQYYVHPASALPSSLNATNERQLEESEFYVNRFRVWQESFRHAYFGFRRLSHHGTLYVRYPEFIACFYIDNKSKEQQDDKTSIVSICQKIGGEQEVASKSINSAKRLRAVVSQSNARLRKELLRHGVEFHVPFNLRALQRPITNLQTNHDDVEGNPAATLGADQSVHGPDSLLHFSGHQAVQGLFEFLLNRKPHSNQDVPEIVAPYPFTNAAIRSVTARFMGNSSVRRTGDDISIPDQKSTTRSEVEITGICLPSTIEELINCLRESQQDEAPGDMEIKAVCETAPNCERLNAVFLDDKHVATSGVARVGLEREMWKQQLDFAKRRLLSVKTAGDRTIEVEMTAR